MEGEVTIEYRLKEAVRTLHTAGYQLNADAFKALQIASTTVDPEEVVEKIIEKVDGMKSKPLFIDKELMEDALKQLHSQGKLKEVLLEDGKTTFHAYALEIKAEVEVVKDPTQETASTGSVESFRNYFIDRFQRLQKILKQRLDAKDAGTVGEALSQQPGAKVKFIAMISDKISRGRNYILRADDLEHIAAVLVQPSKFNAFEKAKSILLDQVVCIVGVRRSNDLIIAEDFLNPEIPQHKPKTAEEPVNVVLTSDLHVGSKVFQGALVERFLLWLNGKLGNERERELASRVKYIVVAGDLVDGIGVYPQQEHELEVKDIYRQYELTVQILQRIPEYISVIFIPGNHDASRKALPQPAIPKKYIGELGGKILSLGNPAQVKLHGVNVLVHHGRSLEDLLVSLPNVDHHSPSKAMVYLLKARHLAPVYGQRMPIAPEPRDWMTIDEPLPDIYHAGHVHILDYTSYRGTLIVNSGCWQTQTLYQKNMGLTPVYGIVPVVNLQTLRLTTLDFTAIGS